MSKSEDILKDQTLLSEKEAQNEQVILISHISIYKVFQLCLIFGFFFFWGGGKPNLPDLLMYYNIKKL